MDSHPLIVQPDGTLLIDITMPGAEAARAAVAPFAELVSSPYPVHTFRMGPISIWSAAATGLTADTLIERLHTFARYSVPDAVVADIREQAGRWGKLHLLAGSGDLVLVADTPDVLREALLAADLDTLAQHIHGVQVPISPDVRGSIKQALLQAGWPVDDRAGYTDGEGLTVALASERFALRDYQRAAADAFYQGGSARGGSGVVVLPPGAGKTVIGIAALALVGQSTLVLTTNNTSVHQWRRELLARTTLRPDDISIYTGEEKRVAPVTISTYQMLTYRNERTGVFPHLRLFSERDWGLLIYDEVHLLPAPVFRATAEIQARRRLGLTATLVREDGREGDVFALIGPKCYEVPWRELEQRGWIASATCIEVRLPLPEDMALAYATAEARDQYRIAAENRRKLPIIAAICQIHPGARTLIIGQYLDQLQYIADNLAAPLITGKTPQPERERLFESFRRGEETLLVLSKVGNFALDLPDADLLIQVSGTFGSRQEEAQRLGRILRPKPDGRNAYFYTVVTEYTREHDYAMNRQLFLVEQGYTYTIIAAEDVQQVADTFEV